MALRLIDPAEESLVTAVPVSDLREVRDALVRGWFLACQLAGRLEDAGRLPGGVDEAMGQLRAAEATVLRHLPAEWEANGDDA